MAASLRWLLRQPFPFDNLAVRQRTALLFGAFVTVFLVVFQPFGFDDLPAARKMPHALAYGAVTWGLMAVRFWAQRWWGERFGWTLARELATGASNLLVIAVGNLLVGQWLGDFSLHPLALAVMVGYTVAIGLLPITILVLLLYSQALRQQVQAAAAVQAQLDRRPLAEATPGPAFLSIQLAGKELVHLAPADLLAATSVENYVNLMYRERGTLRQKLLRGTLSQLAEALSAHPQFVRTHRAWLVNLDALQRVDGNAQGYLLTVADLPQPVPVARRMADAFEAALARVGRSAPLGTNGPPATA